MRIEEIVWLRSIEFFETHDMGDYWEAMPEADFEIDITRRKHIFSLDDELAQKLSEIAKAQQVPSETLVITWLRDLRGLWLRGASWP